MCGDVWSLVSDGDVASSGQMLIGLSTLLLSFFLLSFDILFSLGGNRLGDTAGCAIGMALETNDTLTKLKWVLVVYLCVAAMCSW